eukprot:g43063.t1
MKVTEEEPSETQPFTVGNQVSSSIPQLQATRSSKVLRKEQGMTALRSDSKPDVPGVDLTPMTPDLGNGPREKLDSFLIPARVQQFAHTIGMQGLPQCKTLAFSVRSTIVKLVFFSDHCLLLADCHLQNDQRAGKGTWKLDVKLLTPENIDELKRYYTGWKTVKPLFESPVDWWKTVKGNIK